MNAIDIWEKWSENYRVFKTTYFEDLKASCEDDSIEEEIWSKWYEDWQSIRFAIEQKVQPIIERGLKSSIPTATETKVSVPELLIIALDEYKNGIWLYKLSTLQCSLMQYLIVRHRLLMAFFQVKKKSLNKQVRLLLEC